jgi:hypothetical protein
MKFLNYESFLTESSKPSQGFLDLKIFMKDLLEAFFTVDDVFYDEELDKDKSLFSVMASFSKGILLDTTSRSKEYVTVYPDRLSQETGKAPIEIRRIIRDVLSKHSEISQNMRGNIYNFTYKKR